MSKLKIIYGMFILLLLVGCNSSNDCDIGIFPSEADLAYCSQKGMAKLERCLGIGGHYWDNEEQTCKPIEEIKDCKILAEFERIKTTELPINYDNISEKIDIIKFCSFELIPPKNISCKDWSRTCYEHQDYNCQEYGTDFDFSHYYIYGGREEIELCWN